MTTRTLFVLEGVILVEIIGMKVVPKLILVFWSLTWLFPGTS